MFIKFEVIVKLFQEHEAWVLFKVTAIGEACGWALLLYGIAAARYHLPGAVFMLPLGGSIHGMLFLAYLGVILAGFTSLNWTWRKAAFAVFLSVVPFATWVFEAWCANKRRAEALRSYRRIMIKPVLSRSDRILAIQLSTGLDWSIPGYYITATETPTQAAERIIEQITGDNSAVVADPVVKARGDGQIIFYFHVETRKHHHLGALSNRLKRDLAFDEISFVPGSQIPELELITRSAVVNN
jgi:integral membrane protein